MYHFSSPDGGASLLFAGGCGSSPLTFRHFGRKGYSLFAALGREVKVGVLSVATLATAAPALASGSAAMPTDDATTPSDSTTMDAVLDEATATASRAPLTANMAARTVMTFSRDDIAAAGVTSLNDVVKLCAGVDVRQRGAFGVQTDISIDGGTFDQITILLNGVNISSPHTGHLSADFPVSAYDIERIEVLEGAAARVYGTQAFTGAINIVTRREARSAEVRGYGGMYGYGGGEARLSLPWYIKKDCARVSTLTNHLSGGYQRSDGATPNSQFAASRAFWQGQYVGHDLRIDYQLGYSYKPYGANTFYGAASQDQWESNERWMGAVRLRTQAGPLNLSPTVYWNRWFDHYQWHRSMPGGENFHQVDVYGAAINSWVDWATGCARHKTSLGLEMRSEGIRSTKLGEALEESQWTAVHRGPADSPSTYADGAAPDVEPSYRFGANRTNVSAFLEHNVLLRHWTLSAGLLANLNTALDTRWRFYPGVDVAYRPTARWAIFASWNMALRMPTFTDLYYSGVGIEGTRHLRPERTSDVALKVAYTAPALTVDASAFYSHKSDMIDWVVLANHPLADSADPALDPTDEKNWTYRSGNFTLDNLGLRLNAAWLPRRQWGETFPLRKVALQYCFIDEDISYPTPVLASKYAMEYVRHKVVASADVRLLGLTPRTTNTAATGYRSSWRGGELTLGASYRYCDRTAAGCESYGILDARLAWEAQRYSVFADVNNVLNTVYHDFGYIPQPGIWATAGFALRF